MFTGKALLTLVNVLGAVDALVSRWAGAYVASVDGRGVTHGAWVTRVAGTRVVQVTQKTSL